MQTEPPTICHHVAAHAAERPHARAVWCEERARSWAELQARIEQVAAALHALGVRKGDKVAILGRSSLEALEAFLGALRAGCCAVPLAGTTLPETQRLLLDDSDAKVLFCSDDARPSLAGVADDLPKLLPGARIALDFEAAGFEGFEAWLGTPHPPCPDPRLASGDAFNLIYSSGTTGVPKGILHSHAMRAGTIGRAQRWGFVPGAVNLTSTPLYSNTTMAALLPALAGGATTLLMRKFDERRFLELSLSARVTHAMLVPVQYQRLLAHPDFDRFDLSSYQLKLSTSAPLRAALKREILARWPGELVEIYGLTEGGAVCILEARKHQDKLHTVGRPLAGADVRVIDEAGHELPTGQVGEIVGRQAVMMSGYYKKPAETAAIMWQDAEGRTFQRTGDLGRFDQDGFLELLDRKKDVIISGGFNVYAVDLEAVLSRHESVADVAVIAVPSERWGESPLALVVLRAGHFAEPDALLAWANERLGKTQRLAGVELRASLPRSAIGKLLKRELRAPYWQGR